MRNYLNIFIILMLFISCESSTGSRYKKLSIDGSSTVYPISREMVKLYTKTDNKLLIDLNFSGSNSGINKIITGKIDVANSSRKMTEVEKNSGWLNQLEFMEIPIAFDGLAIVINKNNFWVDFLTVAELKKIWHKDSEGIIKRWNQIRPEWPKEPILLSGPGLQSGTFDFFTEAVNGKTRISRKDYFASEDDEEIADWVMKNKYALGYFGLAYFKEHEDKLKLVPILENMQTVLPTESNIVSGKYKTLTRELVMYVNKKTVSEPESKEFIRFYLKNADWVIKSIGYVPLSKDRYSDLLTKFERFSR